MQFVIDNKITIQIAFQTEPVTATVLDLFEYIENIQAGLPTCLIRLNCRDNDLNFVRSSLYDGAKVNVGIRHETIDFPYKLKLRVFGTPVVLPSQVTNDGYDMTIYCTLDNYPYLSSLTKSSYKGSCSSVLNQLGLECGFKTAAIQTNESQVWYGHGRTYFNLARYITDHCYISDSSLPAVCITHPNTILLKDVTDVLAKKPTHILSYQTKVVYKDGDNKKIDDALLKNSYVFVSYQSKNVAGLYNTVSSYGNSYLQDSVISDNSFESKSVTFTRKLPNSEINKVEKSTIKEVAVNYMPLDIGNTYNKFYEAEAKNKRLRTLYSNILRALTVNEYTKIRPLDCVKVMIDQKYIDSKEDVYSGNYIVTSKTINITRNVFREMITLTNYGRNLKNNYTL